MPVASAAEAVVCLYCGANLAAEATVPADSRDELTPRGVQEAQDLPAEGTPTPRLLSVGMAGQLPQEPRPVVTPTRPEPGANEPPLPGPTPADETKIEPQRPSPYPTGSLLLTSGARVVFPPGTARVTVGREDPVSNVFPELDLTPHGAEDNGVSRRHARFSLHDGELVVEDLDSTNFTFVNGQRVMPGTRQVVRPGDEVRFGRIAARFEP